MLFLINTMDIFKFFIYCLVFLINAGIVLCHFDEEDRENCVILVSFDGFRWDYLEYLSKENNFSKLANDGVFAAKGIQNAFITKTFPNHFTLATGLYEESHGIVGNSLWDPVLNRTIDLLKESGPSLDHLLSGEPIWQTYSRQRTPNKVGCIMWPGCDQAMAMNGSNLQHVLKFNSSVSWETRVDQAIDWIINSQVKLVLLYYHEPDTTGHNYGPASKEIKRMIQEIDYNLGYLIKKMTDSKIFHATDLIVTSDHGMALVNSSIAIFANSSLFKVLVAYDVIWHVLPNPGMENETITYLSSISPNMLVFSKKDIPSKWHYAKNDHVLPVVVIAKPGYTLTLSDYTNKPKIQVEFGTIGTHGYDNNWDQMRPVWLAHGPSFKRGVFADDDLESVDMYLLMCNILKLVPKATNGSIDRIKSMLTRLHIDVFETKANAGWHSIKTNLLITSAVCVSVILFACVMFVAYRWSRSRQRLHYMNLNDHTALTKHLTIAQQLDSDVDDDDNSIDENNGNTKWLPCKHDDVLDTRR